MTLTGGGTLSFTDVATDGSGSFSVPTAGDTSNVTSLEVTDRFGNTGTASF